MSIRPTFSKYNADCLAQWCRPATEEELLQTIMVLTEDFTSILNNRMVWFIISESYGKYYISMYYDNGYNKANGEDL